VKIEAAVAHLAKRDLVMRGVIRRVGPCRLRPHRDRFGILARSIISQQISAQAARSIWGRLEALVQPELPTAANFLALEPERLRQAGVSPQKLGYLADLCGRIGDERLRLDRLGRLSDENVIRELVQVKGIGRWTAQMFLIFSLGRLDVFPHDDLGIRAALRDLYGLDELPGKAAAENIAACWKPYSSVACWYCWRHGEFKNNGDAGAAGGSASRRGRASKS
jgi:DNA-3-methyladenine glycosylase II